MSASDHLNRFRRPTRRGRDDGDDSGDDNRPSRSSGTEIKPFRYLLIGLLVLCGFTSWFTVDKNENATVRTFGEHTRTVEPGLAFKLPWPLEVATTTAVKTAFRMEIGSRTQEMAEEGRGERVYYVPEEAEMLTSDLNIVMLRFNVQYFRSDAAKWQFVVRDPELLLNYLAQTSMRFVVGQTPFYKITTDGKFEVQQQVQKMLQELCDEIGFGANIFAVQLQGAHPPEEVQDSFRDVNTAKENKEQIIHEADQYANEQLPQARGTAEEKKNNAKGYAAETVNKAKGDTARFTSVWEEYKKNPDITKLRLVLETLNEVIPGSDIKIITGGQGNILQHLPLGNGETFSEKKKQ